MLAVITCTALENEVYLDPQDGRALPGENRAVEIWASASTFFGGQITLLYDPECVEVTNWVRNADNFPLGGWDSSADGKEWITFSTMPPTPSLTGDYILGTLTVRCAANESEEGCETLFVFVAPSTLLTDRGNPVPAHWVNGTFECTHYTTLTSPSSLTATPTPKPSVSPTAVEEAHQTMEEKAEVPAPPAPARSPSPSPPTTATPLTAPTHTPAPMIGGVEAAIAIGILALLYLSLKRRRVAK